MARCPLQCQEVLVPEAVINSKSRVFGNHYSEIITRTKGGKKVNVEIRFVYHETAICKVNTQKKVFMTDNGGWNTVSTRCAIHGYQILLPQFGYTEVTKESYNYLMLNS